MSEQATNELPEYTAWAKVPDGLRTKTGLRELGLRPGQGQKPAARFRNVFNDNRYPLYEVSLAVPRPPVSEAALARLEAARARMTRLRYCDTCNADSLSLQDYARLKAQNRLAADADGNPNTQYRCRFCEDRLYAAAWAREVLEDEKAVILDTETTGLDEEAEIVEIAIINTKGDTLFESLVRPRVKMGATHIHGITAEDVEGSPTWLELNDRLFEILRVASRIVVYNADFDRRMIFQTWLSWRQGYPLKVMAAWDNYELPWQCAMEMYSQWYGVWSSYHRSYRWQRLDGDHRALGDARACLEFIKRMAGMDPNKLKEEQYRW